MALPLSRTQQKKQVKEIEKLVFQLAELPPAVQARLPLSADTRELLGDCRRLKGGARKRQLKYIARLLRKQPLEEVYQFVAREKGEALKRNRELHELEYVRDLLLNEAILQSRDNTVSGEQLQEYLAGGLLDEIMRQFPTADRMALARLASFYARTRKKKYSREIFRLLHRARQQQILSAGRDNDR